MEDTIINYSNYIPASTNPFSRFVSDTIMVRNTSTITDSVDRYRHSNLSKRGDHCPACYESYILAMSNRYFENLKKQIANEVMSAIVKEKI